MKKGFRTAVAAALGCCLLTVNVSAATVTFTDVTSSNPLYSSSVRKRFVYIAPFVPSIILERTVKYKPPAAAKKRQIPAFLSGIFIL